MGALRAPTPPSRRAGVYFISSLHPSHSKSVYFASAPREGGMGALRAPIKQSSKAASAHTS